MQYVVVLTIDEAVLDGDDSIEHGCRIANDILEAVEGTVPVEVRPLSEVMAC